MTSKLAHHNARDRVLGVVMLESKDHVEGSPSKVEFFCRKVAYLFVSSATATICGLYRSTPPSLHRMQGSDFDSEHPGLLIMYAWRRYFTCLFSFLLHLGESKPNILFSVLNILQNCVLISSIHFIEGWRDLLSPLRSYPEFC